MHFKNYNISFKKTKKELRFMIMTGSVFNLNESSGHYLNRTEETKINCIRYLKPFEPTVAVWNVN